MELKIVGLKIFCLFSFRAKLEALPFESLYSLRKLKLLVRFPSFMYLNIL